MPINNSKELFVTMLSSLRHGAERSNKVFQEMSQVAQDSDIKEALEARVFVSDKILNTLDECFKLIREKPLKASGRLYDVFAEDFRKELSEIHSAEGKRLFVLARVNALIHLRIGEYVALIEAADLMGHHGLGVLLESCLADNLAFVERTRRLIRSQMRELVAA